MRAPRRDRPWGREGPAGPAGPGAPAGPAGPWASHERRTSLLLQEFWSKTIRTRPCRMLRHASIVARGVAGRGRHRRSAHEHRASPLPRARSCVDSRRSSFCVDGKTDRGTRTASRCLVSVRDRAAARRRFKPRCGCFVRTLDPGSGRVDLPPRQQQAERDGGLAKDVLPRQRVEVVEVDGAVELDHRVPVAGRQEIDADEIGADRRCGGDAERGGGRRRARPPAGAAEAGVRSPLAGARRRGGSPRRRHRRRRRAGGRTRPAAPAPGRARRGAGTRASSAPPRARTGAPRATRSGRRRRPSCRAAA